MSAVNGFFSVFGERQEYIEALVAGVAEKVVGGHKAILTESGSVKQVYRLVFSNSKSETNELNAKPLRRQVFDLSLTESAGMPDRATASQKSPCDFATWR
jgi:hypothetical protein